MIFSSFEFIFFCLITLFLYYRLGAIKQQYAILFLVLSSLFFYAWWKVDYLIILIASILFNYFLANYIRINKSKSLLIIGIVFNLSALIYYKYAAFLIFNLNQVAHSGFDIPTILLPLAISFFTFQQIAYLVDTYRDESFEYNFLNYSLFVTFFPQLIAGPIVHHKEMMPQFAKGRIIKVNWLHIKAGFIYFALGLFKKVVIADMLAIPANSIFNAADSGVVLSVLDAWLGALAYTFQLYFDFSGYADMAIGIGLMFNIVLPFNFNSPYKAKNIIDFWRRWHITLSRFLRDYLYIALGGSRQGKFKRYRNLLLTMLLGGLWHGAGWNFIIWGGLHGCYLCINHLWLYIASKNTYLSKLLKPFFAQIITFFAVVIAWVFFRATTFDGAISIITNLFNLANNPAQIFSSLQHFQSWLWVLIAMIIAFWAPNTKEFTEIKHGNIPITAKVLFFTSIFMMWVLLINQQTQEFIYFNF